MSKRSKSQSDHEPWVKDSSSVQINDKEFKCSVSIVVESNKTYRFLSLEFDKYSRSGYRECIKCISQNKILEFLFTHISKNGVQTPLSTLCDTIAEENSRFFKENIPMDHYKYLIKYIVQDLKERRISELKRKNLAEIESANKIRKYEVSTAARSNKSDNKVKEAKFSGKNQQVVSSRFNSKLNTRNENLRCLENVEDNPFDGPDLYVLLIQSQHSDLPLQLLALNVPVTSIIHLGHIETFLPDDETTYQKELKENANLNNLLKEILKSNHIDTSVKDRSLISEMDIRTYWTQLLDQMNYPPHSNSLKNIAILKYTPDIPAKKRHDNFIDDLRRSFYDGISKVVFKDATLKELHKSYTKFSRINVDSKDIVNLTNLKYYNAVMNSLPLDVTSVEVILDSVVSQVCLDLNSDIGYERNVYTFLATDKKPETTDVKTPSCLHQLIERLSQQNFDNIEFKRLTRKKDHNLYVFHSGEELTKTNEYLELDLKEFVRSRNRHIQELFFSQLLEDNVHKLKTCVENENKTIKQEIANVIISLIDVTSTNGVNSIKFNNLKTFYDKIQNTNIVDVISDYCVMDVLTRAASMQMIPQVLFDTFLYDISYSAIGGKYVIKCHDTKHPVKKLVVLPSVKSLQEFVEDESGKYKFNTTEIFKQRKKFNYSDMLGVAKRESSFSVLDVSTKYIPHCYNKQEYSSEEWLESSYNDIFEQRSKYKYFMTKHNKKEESGRDVLKEPLLYNMNSDRQITFQFYDMKIKMNKDSITFLKYTESLYLNKYDIHVLTKLKSHQLNYRTNFKPNDLIKKYKERSGALFLRHSSGIIFSFLKTLDKYTNKQPADFPELDNLNFAKNKKKLPNADWVRFDLNIVWPNGLTIKRVNQNNSHYITQCYNHIKPKELIREKEVYRCYLNDGTVIKFMENNNVIVLHANGRVIKIQNFQGHTDKVIKATNQINKSKGETKSSFEKKNKVNSPRNEIKTSAGKPPSTDSKRDENKILSMNYEMRETTGSRYRVKGNSKEKLELLFQEELVNVLECSITTEHSDGVVYVHKRDGSLSIKYTDGTEITTFVAMKDDFVPELNTEILGSYTVIDMCFKIDHDCYATTLFSYGGDSSVLTMHDNIQVTFSEDITIDFDGIQITNFESCIEVIQEEYKNKMTYSFENDQLSNEMSSLMSPLVHISDCNNNMLLIFENGKFELDNSHVKDRTYADKRTFVLDKRYSGFEILSKRNLNERLNWVKSIENSVIRQKNCNEHIEHTAMLPIPLVDKWSVYNDNLKTPISIYQPSTYGTEWFFPFKMKETKCEINPEVIWVRHFTEIIKVHDLIEEIKINFKEDFQPEISTSEKSEDSNFNFLLALINKYIEDPLSTLKIFKMGSNYLDTECTRRDSFRYIKTTLKYKKEQVLDRRGIDRIKNKYKQDRYNLVNKKIINYFETGEGAVFDILNGIIRTVNSSQDKQIDNRELTALLSIPIEEIDQDLMDRIKTLIFKLNKSVEFPCLKKYSIDRLMEAGKSLGTHFRTMEEVLLFHEGFNPDALKKCAN